MNSQYSSESQTETQVYDQECLRQSRDANHNRKWTKFIKDNSLELATGYQQSFVKAFIETNTSGKQHQLPDERKPKRLQEAFMFIMDSYKFTQVHCKTADNCGYHYMEPQVIKQYAVNYEDADKYAAMKREEDRGSAFQKLQSSTKFGDKNKKPFEKGP